MSKPKTHPRTVLFLGAGASAAFGLPVTSAIFPYIRNNLLSRTLFPTESNPKRERAKMDRLHGYLSTFLPAVFEEDIELPLITDVLSLIDQLLSTGEIGIPMVSTNDMEDFRTLLVQAIVETIEAARSDPRSNQALDRLTDWVLNMPESGETPLTIVSTNYDTLLESFLFEKLEIDLYDLEMRLGNFVDMGFSWREHTSGTFLETIYHPPKDPRLKIYKLHGSLSWLKCPLCGFTYVNTTGTIFRQAFRGDKIDYNNTCVCGHGPMHAVIVAPSMVRSIQDPNLLTIWRSSLEAMRTATEWIIVGYSLPPEDIAIRSIFLRAYHGRGRKGKFPNIRVIQREEDTLMEGRYRLLFPECKFEYGGFEEFIRALPKPKKHYETF
jgi:NAD-dependent SIR2 family protein deacetylase